MFDFRGVATELRVMSGCHEHLMRSLPMRAAAAAALTGILVIGVPGAGNAQSDAFDASYSPPRTAYGDPDLQGVWSNAVLTPLERPEDLADKATLTEAEAREYARRRREADNRDRRVDDSNEDVADAYNDFWWDSGDNIVRTRRTSLIVDPPDGRLPELTPAGRQRLQARRASSELPAGPEDLSLSTRCIHIGSAGPPMLPSVYNNNYHLVQTEDHVLIVNEMVHDARIVPLDGRGRLHEDIRQWLGSSRGRWDGDTLVVETTNRRDETSVRGTGMNMLLTERFTRVADDVLMYEFTVDDPENFTRSWSAQIPSIRADGLMYEYACHEGNRGMLGILAGARAAEEAD